MLGLSRFARLFILITIAIIVPTLYLLYPNQPSPPSPGDEVHEYEAGGIDSPHWRRPLAPDFEREAGRWAEEEVVVKVPAIPSQSAPEQVEEGRGWGGVEESVLGGGVIMPKLENATAK